jgi:hypothetical protein
MILEKPPEKMENDRRLARGRVHLTEALAGHSISLGRGF